MIINSEEYITWEELGLLKNIYITPSLKPNYNCVYPEKHQIDELHKQSQAMTIYSFLSDETGYFNLTTRYDPLRDSMEYLNAIMHPSPSFLNEYGIPLYSNPFAYQHKLPKGQFRIY